MLHLRNVVAFVPDESFPVQDLRDPLDLSAKEVRLLTRFFGLDRISTIGKLAVTDMLLATGEEALTGTDRSQVRYVIHAHTVQHIVPPYLRHMDMLREKLGLDEARSFTMAHQSCVTGLYALKAVEALLRAEPAGSTALILVGEKVLSTVMQHIRTPRCSATRRRPASLPSMAPAIPCWAWPSTRSASSMRLLT